MHFVNVRLEVIGLRVAMERLELGVLKIMELSRICADRSFASPHLRARYPCCCPAWWERFRFNIAVVATRI